MTMVFTTDGKRYNRDRLAQRTLVCQFKGSAFIAEGEGEDLSIYHISGDNGLENELVTIDRARGAEVTAAVLQRRNEEWRRRQKAL